MVRITSNGGYDDGLSMRRQRIRTKFGTKISWGMSIERLKRSSMDNISIHIRDLVNMGDGSTGSKLYCLVGCSITALNLQLTHYSSGKNKENNENLLGKLASDQEQSKYNAGFQSEGR
jgi:hypothetical protein